MAAHKVKPAAGAAGDEAKDRDDTAKATAGSAPGAIVRARGARC